MLAIILDMEYTTWEGARERKWSGAGEHREIVQIVAKKVDISASGINVLDTFNHYVKPQINTQLSELFVELTAITQEQIDHYGEKFDDVILPLHDFIDNNVVFSWTNNDFSVICENVKLYNIAENPIAPFYNMQEIFHNHGEPIWINSGHLAQSYDLPPAFQEHNALDDVSSIVMSVEHLLITGKIAMSDFEGLTPQWSVY